MNSPAAVQQIQTASAIVASGAEARGNGEVGVAAKALGHARLLLSIVCLVAVAAAGSQAIPAAWSRSQSVGIGEIRSSLWLTSGILLPALLVCIPAYRTCRRRQQQSGEIERLGPYILKEKLGSGGMGDVFLAEHQLMKRKCAVKLIHPEQAKDREMRNSFEREARATAQLTHWNTIEVYDYGTSEDGRFYYVMEYLRGVNLWEYVEQYGPMEPARVVYILKQLCDALYEADSVGLVHRDIKPSNVFLTERGRSCDVAKLLDFGLVQAATSQPIKLRNVSTTLQGSPSFMCPEQAVGLTPDCRGDLYSLGAVAYFLLTGHPPFVDDNPIMLIVAHATTAVPGLEETGVDVPQDLANVIMKCLSRQPADRFDSARDLLMALEACQCSADWSWQQAEEWWSRHHPDHHATRTSACNEDTITMSQENSAAGDGPRRQTTEPTDIYHAPAELALSRN